jgi:hypothetical protein
MGADLETAAIRATRDEARWGNLEYKKARKRQAEETRRRRQEFIDRHRYDDESPV